MFVGLSQCLGYWLVFWVICHPGILIEPSSILHQARPKSEPETGPLLNSCQQGPSEHANCLKRSLFSSLKLSGLLHSTGPSSLLHHVDEPLVRSKKWRSKLIASFSAIILTKTSFHDPVAQSRVEWNKSTFDISKYHLPYLSASRKANIFSRWFFSRSLWLWATAVLCHGETN